jgi:DNA-binding transcriptional LysR family regulator
MLECNRMEMHEIRYFLAVCETLNFTRAAEISNVTQPALTRAIQKLERELGGFVFHRDHAHVTLTQFGSLMQAHLEDVYRRTEGAKQAARTFLTLEKAPLTLGVMCTIGPLRFLGLLADFHTRYPGIEMRITEATSARLVAMLLDGSLDVALLASPQPIDARLQAQRIYSERFGLAFPAGHAFESAQTLRLADVHGEAYLDRINCEYASYIDQLCLDRGIEILSAYQSEREDWIMAMVAAGMGVCFMPEFSATQPGVLLRPLADPEIVREIAVVTVRGRPRSPALTAFVDAVQGRDWKSMG